MHLIDTHAHLDFSDFDPDRPAVIERASLADVREIISIGTKLDSSARAIELAENFPNIWATVGIHPCDLDEIPEDYLSQLRQLAQSRRVVAFGEIGLDYHHLPGENNSTEGAARNSETVRHYKEKQQTVFREQLDLAVELGFNVVIHQRDSWDDTLKILRNYTGKIRGVFHCFGGSPAQAHEVIELGHLVSFTGIVTFKNAVPLQETAKSIPDGTFMVETDCPFLAPVPYRGKRCDPAHTRLVAEQIARLRQTSLEKLAEMTTETARRFFHFKR